MRKTAAHLGMVLSRTAFSTCKACVIGKAKQHNIPKETIGEKVTIFNGRVGHDFAKIKAPEELKVSISKLNWHSLVDEALGFKQSKFFETKGGIIPYMCKLMYAESNEGIQFKSCTKTMLVKRLSGRDCQGQGFIS